MGSVAEDIDNSKMVEGQVLKFRVAGGLFGLRVEEIQEVIKPHVLTKVPLAKNYICGLMNLRGQIVTTVDMTTLLGIKPELTLDDYRHIIVRKEDSLVAIKVDSVSDVIEVDASIYETTPDSLDENVKDFIAGVYKLDTEILSLIDLEKVFNTNV